MRWIGRSGTYYSENDLIIIRRVNGKWNGTSQQGDWLLEAESLKKAKAIAEAKIKTWEVY
jgi:hypothetical protein|nr:MAG TPA: hypothetical protein [Caudoviricetes sp.]